MASGFGALASVSAVIVAACAVVFACFSSQLQSFPDRLAALPAEAAAIDNVQPYDAMEKWAPNGSQAGLHLMNPTRVAYFHRAMQDSARTPLRVLDMGCGGGLVSNALARLPGYAVIEGVDLSPEALQYAAVTAERAPGRARANFRNASVYDLPFEAGTFDAVILSDVLEHLLDIPAALREAARVLTPGGLLLFDTIDRSPVSFVVAILGAEYIVRIIDRGSHDWRLFVRPEELRRGLHAAGFTDVVHEGFQPSVRALLELSAFSAGVMPAERMSGGWGIEPPSVLMVSYIGRAVKG